jgi:phage baseplate assembly protein W
MITTTDPSFVHSTALGANWRLQFTDPDGSPMNMGSFEVIDFGAIGYFEIFQNVKTILATPLFSAALERTLGVDQGIVDRPITEAAHVTVAILDALTFWEPRVQVVDINFDAEPLVGHLIVNLKLAIRNVIYGTDTPYNKTSAFDAVLSPTKTPGQLPPSVGDPTPGPIGPPGPQGTRGSLWWSGSGSPATAPIAPIQMAGRPVPGPPGVKGKRGSLWLAGDGDPVAPLDKDMYLNATNGDVWQYDGSAQMWRLTSK